MSMTQLPITMHVACTWTTPKGSLSSLAKPPTMPGDFSKVTDLSPQHQSDYDAGHLEGRTTDQHPPLARAGSVLSN
jgi:hypothetical protein